MSLFRSTLLEILNFVEGHVDDLSLKIKKRFALSDPLHIVPYRSYGTVNRLYVKGRVMENKNIQASTDKDTLWNNIVSMYKRFESDEVPGALLKVYFQEQEYLVTTDEEGYFVCNLVTDVPVQNEDLWHDIKIALINAPLPFEADIAAEAQVLVPPFDCEYGIISDIDDTIVKTGATDLLAMSRNTFFKNAHSRLPFPGVAEFYKSLQLGRNGKRNNPFFYVSSSPWNLYDLLVDFMDLNAIPPGPLLLRDYGIGMEKFMPSDHLGHKGKEIEQILAAYPSLKFVLIGDSGQQDPIIYQSIVEKFPGRILAVYIRDVQLEEREKVAIKISESLRNHQVEMVIVDTTVEAADHAAKIGLIFRETIPQIEVDKDKDKGKLPGKETL